MEEVKQIMEFLYGAAPLDGVWFGGDPPEGKGRYWWRSKLRVAIEAALSSSAKAAEPVAWKITRDKKVYGMSKNELEAQFTKEDPRYPARKAASEALHAHIDQWFKDYEFTDGEGGYHSPSEFERFMIVDAFYGLTADDDYTRLHAAWRALCGPPGLHATEAGGADLRDQLAPLLNAFGELHWRSGRSHNVPHEQIDAAFEAVIAAATQSRTLPIAGGSDNTEEKS